MSGARSQERTLRRLFLTLFLRGRTSRGLRKQAAPKSVESKLALTLVVYALVGLVALGFLGQPVLSLSLYLHAMTLVFLGMFVAASAGEVLFNKEEADILLHRPVAPRALLWAKVSVLVQVSLWLAGAFNLAGLVMGTLARDGGWLFPLAHAGSTALEALFCTGGVVLAYQLVLRWCGRERLEGLMTTAQVLVAVLAVVGGQLVPQLLVRFGGPVRFEGRAAWLAFLPPAWFAGFDDVLAGSRRGTSWALAAVGLAATALVLWLAFGKLARAYETGLQALGETRSAPREPRGGRRWFQALVHAPPLCWWLRQPVTRAAFLLTAVYLVRDRDVKLRLYPGLAPMLVIPVMMLLPGRGPGDGLGGFGVAFCGGYLGLVPLLAMNLLQYSQQWQAADIFRVAPMTGPAPLCHGARRAVLVCLTLPLVVVVGLIAAGLSRDLTRLLLLLPGVLALPVYALIPCLGGRAVPLSLPPEEAKSAGRGLTMVGVMLVAMALSGLAAFAWSTGWFWWLLAVETVVVAVVHFALRAAIAQARWRPWE
jgi:hypothetical protein